jgi:hypothetical protein
VDEQWKYAVGFPNYLVSDQGRVNGPRGDVTQCIDRKGYRSVNLTADGKRVKRAVQRLVAEAFIGPRPAGCVVRHRDGDNSHNAATNLRYGTPTENEADKREHGTTLLGERHPAAKLNEEQVRAIRARCVLGTHANGASAIARELGVSHELVIKIARRQLWSHVA